MKYVILAWLAGLTGFGLLITGVAMVSQPAAFIVAGLGLMAWSYLADKASATPATGGG
jgi:cytochrome b subunit of formate dehydrogenase